MKKNIFIILLTILIFLTYSVTFQEKETSEYVFYEENIQYKKYSLDLSDTNITTKNILEYFDCSIIEIKPYINPIYQKIITDDIYYFNDSISNEKNISLFIEHYTNKLEINALKKELEKIYFNGIKINAIKIYITDDGLNSILNNNKKIKLIDNY